MHRLSRLSEQIIEAVVQIEHDERANGEEGQQLDQRFEGNRRTIPGGVR